MRLAAAVPAGLVLAMAVATPRPQPPAAQPGAGQLRLPVAGAAVSQPFGCTSLELEPVSPQCPGGHFHAGVDYAAPAGTPVVAAAAGVASPVNDSGGYGLHVVIGHDAGWLTLYGHLSQVAVAGGQPVSAGQEIGRVGSSGLSTGPHLHFEVRHDGRPVDPAPLIH